MVEAVTFLLPIASSKNYGNLNNCTYRKCGNWVNHSSHSDNSWVLPNEQIKRKNSVYWANSYSHVLLMNELENWHVSGIHIHVQWNLNITNPFIRAVIERQGPGIFPQLLWTSSPATFKGKWKKNRTERNSSLFDSPPTCCVYSATWNLSDNPAIKTKSSV